MSGGPATYVKAFVGGVTSAGAAAVAGLADGSFTTGETITTIVAFFVGFGAVYQLPNKADADPTTSTPDLSYERTGGYASPSTPVTTLPEVPAGPAPGIIRPQTNGLATGDDPPSGALPTVDDRFQVEHHFDSGLQSRETGSSGPDSGAPDGATEVR